VPAVYIVNEDIKQILTESMLEIGVRIATKGSRNYNFSASQLARSVFFFRELTLDACFLLLV
jgi:hypothetical protein